MSEKTEMMADMVKSLAILLVRQHKELTMEQALSTVFNSNTYRKVMNEQTHFYYQKQMPALTKRSGRHPL